MSAFDSLRICIIGPVPPPAGGMANQTADLCHRLEQEGAQVKLVATNAPYRPPAVGYIQGVRALFRLFPYLIRLYQGLRHADVAHLMANSGWSWHLFATPAIWIAHLLGTPIVVNYRGGLAESFFSGSWRWIGPTITKAQACVVPSAFLAKVFSKYQIDTRIVPNTLDPELFHPATQPRQNGSGPVIVITRNLETIYGIDLALHAMPIILEQYPDAHLLIAGSGPELASLQQIACELNINNQVSFCGRLSHREMADFYRQANLVLNPSRVDNSPNSIIEALACGVPVVSSRAGGIPLLVTHGETAYLVDMNSAKELAEGVLAVLQNASLRDHLIGAGLAFSQKFHWNQIKSDLLQIYQVARSQSR